MFSELVELIIVVVVVPVFAGFDGKGDKLVLTISREDKKEMVDPQY